MCVYIYCYYSTCQHGELTRVTYCNTATALGLPKHDRHSPDGAGADNFPGAQPGPSSSHPPASSANNTSSSHSHTQQNHNNMSTLNPSEPGTPISWNLAVTGRDAHLPRQAAFIPRSALNGGPPANSADGTVNGNALLDTQGYRNLNIDFPLNTQSSLSMELTQDGKVMELVARFESFASYSDAPEVSYDDHTHASSLTTHRPSTSDVGTAPELPEQHVHFEHDSHAIGTARQEQHSPRKPIPAQWLPKNNGPSLATAQRAKERSHKKGSQSGSPIEVKTLRGTRSSVDLGRTHGAEGATFLTKEALAAVDTNITSRTPSRSPTKLHCSPSKSPWHSPSASPLRSSPRQHSTLTIKTSPCKPVYRGAELAPAGHLRAPSSVATSVGANSFHTAEGSPVRSSAGSELSFQSAAEDLEYMDSLHSDSNTDSENDQTIRDPTNVRLSPVKPTTEDKVSSNKPKLALKIPPPNSLSDNSCTSAASSTSAMSVSPLSPTSPVQTSRIPRVAVASNTGSARGPTRSSTLKRTQSAKSLISKAKAQEEQSLDSPQLLPLNKSVVVSPHYVRTLTSSGTTSILSHTSTVNILASSCNTSDIAYADVQPAETELDKVNTLALEFNRTTLAEHATSRDDCVSGKTSRATSSTTVKASLADALRDPVLIDSAIIYSRKKSDAIGTLNKSDTQDDTSLVNSSHAVASTRNTSPVRGRTEWYSPAMRRQEESEHSMPSSLGSDLRATAPEFVPQTAPTSFTSSSSVEVPAPAQLDQTTDLADLSGLDRHGIPWVYYMYPIQFAYEQGFRNGRSKSPKKFKPKKQRSSVSSPTDAPHHLQNISVPTMGSKPASGLLSEVPQRQLSAVLMPPPPLPAHRLQEPAKREHSTSALTMNQKLETAPRSDDSYGPFSTQIGMVTQLATLRNRTTSNNKPPYTNVDATTIHNVGLPLGPRNMHAPIYYTVPHQGGRRDYRYAGNGLYGGRVAAGVPMHSTVPFPDPVPPQGRPDQGQAQSGSQNQCMGYTAGTEACGMINIAIATERGGGEACNACEPDH